MSDIETFIGLIQPASLPTTVILSARLTILSNDQGDLSRMTKESTIDLFKQSKVEIRDDGEAFVGITSDYSLFTISAPEKGRETEEFQDILNTFRFSGHCLVEFVLDNVSLANPKDKKRTILVSLWDDKEQKWICDPQEKEFSMAWKN